MTTASTMSSMQRRHEKKKKKKKTYQMNKWREREKKKIERNEFTVFYSEAIDYKAVHIRTHRDKEHLALTQNTQAHTQRLTEYSS